MIHPSYVDLMKVVNKDVEEGEEPIISSRYSIVMATARRARQIIAGDEELVRAGMTEKALSVAVREINDAQVRILTDEEKEEMDRKRLQEVSSIGSELEEVLSDREDLKDTLEEERGSAGEES